MILETFTAGPCETNAYLVGCPSTLRAFVIDVPPESGEMILKRIKEKGLSLEKILLTHSHWDHIGDVALLKQATGAEVLVHPLDGLNLRVPGSDRLPLYFAVQGVEPDSFLQEGTEIHVGDLSIQTIATPGHTPGGVCFYLEREGVLFSGDTLFLGTMGRVDFPTSDPEAMWTSLAKLAKLPKATKVFPGHGSETTIGREMWMVRAKEIDYE